MAIAIPIIGNEWHLYADEAGVPADTSNPENDRFFCFGGIGLRADQIRRFNRLNLNIDKNSESSIHKILGGIDSCGGNVTGICFDLHRGDIGNFVRHIEKIKAITRPKSPPRRATMIWGYGLGFLVIYFLAQLLESEQGVSVARVFYHGKSLSKRDERIIMDECSRVETRMHGLTAKLRKQRITVPNDFSPRVYKPQNRNAGDHMIKAIDAVAYFMRERIKAQGLDAARKLIGESVNCSLVDATDELVEEA